MLNQKDRLHTEPVLLQILTVEFIGLRTEIHK